VRAVAARLALQPEFAIVTVAGTNGKGSTCAFLEAMLAAAGYCVGLYTSPHLVHFNERIRIGGTMASDTEISAALAAVEAARDAVSLTYFEHATLAAMWLFCRAPVDVAVLEVGLGGRLDAVNLFDADCAVVTSIDLDHQAYLGEDRESIGFEKAGIFRARRPAICADRDPPASLRGQAAAVGAAWQCLGRDFYAEAATDAATWTWRDRATVLPALPRSAMPGAYQYDNAAAAIAALVALRVRLPVPLAAMRAGLAQARQPGRFQVIGWAPLRILDVAHNPHAARALAANLADLPPTGRRFAVLGMYADKDRAGVIAALHGRIDVWHLASLPGPRGASAAELAGEFAAHPVEACDSAAHTIHLHDDVASAWRAACQEAGGADTILAFGSFHTVADILRLNGNDG